MNIAVPIDPLHWQISQDASTSLFACLANTLGAAESVLRVATTGHGQAPFPQGGFLSLCALRDWKSSLRRHCCL
ncbi:reticulon-like protein b23 [Phtheirospermum japonicum]|uniref:Reticulon-like protein b23 n=1 Tax=Phtheirospermum japonicum TaxID=374723 RepID=A0A830BX96_9LAMI|nr:reticulon-like protein b23 [Phtheirospermum japonicum]